MGKGLWMGQDRGRSGTVDRGGAGDGGGAGDPAGLESVDRFAISYSLSSQVNILRLPKESLRNKRNRLPFR